MLIRAGPTYTPTNRISAPALQNQAFDDLIGIQFF